MKYCQICHRMGEGLLVCCARGTKSVMFARSTEYIPILMKFKVNQNATRDVIYTVRLENLFVLVNLQKYLKAYIGERWLNPSSSHAISTWVSTTVIKASSETIKFDAAVKGLHTTILVTQQAQIGRYQWTSDSSSIYYSSFSNAYTNYIRNRQ